MGWDKGGAERHPCPCGRGEYEQSYWSDDWGRAENHYDMLCPHCKELYVYVRHAADRSSSRPCGWTLKSVLEAGQHHRDDVTARAKALCWNTWRGKFAGLKTKKQQWEVLTRHGRFYPAYGSFCDHTRGKSAEDVTAYIDHYFSYHNLRQVFEVCGVQPNWAALGVTPEEIRDMQPDLTAAHEAAVADLAALKRRIEKAPRLLWVHRCAPRGEEWRVTRASILQGGRLSLQVVQVDKPNPITTAVPDAGRLFSEGKLRFEDAAGSWRLER
jgi:hypothetical protein